LLYFKRPLICLVALAAMSLPLSAQAGAASDTLNMLGTSAAPALTAAAPDQPAVPTLPAIFSRNFSVHDAELVALDMPRLPSVAIPELPTPSVEIPLKKLFCVEYARARSGLAVFGDAKFWWARAKNLYARLSSPVEEAVMVFTASGRIRKGHVAVVTDIVSAREIRVDQANWENHGEIDHSTPVLDVSKKNDWSRVRVWDRRSQSFGGHVYAISGFIAKGLTRQASNQ
jgi:hypothetical protein